MAAIFVKSERRDVGPPSVGDDLCKRMVSLRARVASALVRSERNGCGSWRRGGLGERDAPRQRVRTVRQAPCAELTHGARA